jgi:hypothetical protein
MLPQTSAGQRAEWISQPAVRNPRFHWLGGGKAISQQPCGQGVLAVEISFFFWPSKPRTANESCRDLPAPRADMHLERPTSDVSFGSVTVPQVRLARLLLLAAKITAEYGSEVLQQCAPIFGLPVYSLPNTVSAFLNIN